MNHLKIEQEANANAHARFPADESRTNMAVDHDSYCKKTAVSARLQAGRGATRHCCYGMCNSDSRYADRDHMQGVTWIVFPKLHIDREKCQKWVAACGRDRFTTDSVNKWTYICSKHFVGGHGPTEANPDPVPATYTPAQVCK